MIKKCYIAGAGEFCENKLPEHGDYIIAANGGYTVLTRLGITPDLVVGDFDSVDKDTSILESLQNHPNVIGSPAEKDDTDMMLAVKQGLKLGFNFFVINGALGGRLDQTFANIQILAYIASNNATGVLLGQKVNVTAIKNSTVLFSPGDSTNIVISVFCHGDKAEGVMLEGVKYPLTGAVLSNSYPVGISNEFIGEDAKISVQKGILIIFYPEDAEFNTNKMES